VALSTVRGTVRGTRLVLASGSLETNLTQACGIVTALTILAIRADGLGAVHSAIANITLALASHAVAHTVARATIGAHLLFAGLAHEPRCTVADTIDTAAVGGAVTRATLQ